MNYYIIGSVILLIIFAIYVYFNMSNSKIPNVNVGVSGPFSLSSKISTIKSSNFPSAEGAQAFLTGGAGVFEAYIYLDSLSQTGSLSSCGTRPNQPSCTSGMYDQCTCKTRVDCNNCSHDGYKNLVSLYGVYNLEILPFPDASRQNSVSAQIAVNTQTADESFIETIPLPPIPIQKWVFLTISKTGRRIDVYYNDSLVKSTTMLNMISTLNPSGSIVQTGDSGLSGTIAEISIGDFYTTIGQVAIRYSNISDTRGAPVNFGISLQSYTNNVNTAGSSDFMKSLCLDGSCLKMPRVGNVNATLSQFTDSLDGLSSTATKSKISPAFNVGTSYA